MSRFKAALAALIPVLLAGCSANGRVTEMGVITTRSACPAVAIPAATGDVTLFNPETSRDENAIDVVATITNVRSTCDESGNVVVADRLQTLAPDHDLTVPDSPAGPFA